MKRVTNLLKLQICLRKFFFNFISFIVYIFNVKLFHFKLK